MGPVMGCFAARERRGKAFLLPEALAPLLRRPRWLPPTSKAASEEVPAEHRRGLEDDAKAVLPPPPWMPDPPRPRYAAAALPLGDLERLLAGGGGAEQVGLLASLAPSLRAMADDEALREFATKPGWRRIGVGGGGKIDARELHELVSEVTPKCGTSGDDLGHVEGRQLRLEILVVGGGSGGGGGEAPGRHFPASAPRFPVPPG